MSDDIVARLWAAVPCGLRIRPGERCEAANLCDQCELMDRAATEIEQLRQVAKTLEMRGKTDAV